MKSGGSTGIPITVIHEVQYSDRGRAGRMYPQHLCGFPFGVPYFRLWGSMAEIDMMRVSFAHRTTSALAGEVLLNAFTMDDDRAESYLDLMNRSDISYLMAYVDCAHHLARYALFKGLKVRPLKSIMACAATVTANVRQDLEEVFRAGVHNKYGTRDCAEIACECVHRGLHYYANHVHLETFDEDGRPTRPGETGTTLFTLLHNRAFPLIRYEVGDMGSFSADDCPCGRPYPLLENIEGRVSEFHVTTSGGYVSPVYLQHLIGVVHAPGWIDRFQIVQKSSRFYQVFLVLTREVHESELADTTRRLKQSLAAVFGRDAEVSIAVVDRIDEAQSGKFLYTVNLVPPSGN